MIKSQSHIAAPVPQPIMDRAAQLIHRVRYDQPASQHVDLMYEVIMDMTVSGMEFYFMEPLRRVNAGSMTMKIAQMGLSSTQKGIRMVIRKVLHRLTEEQLVAITGFIEEILFEAEEAKAA
ncbi:hypothetical protein AAIA72_07430 [Hahella sp. SMD15-11]|uniref:Uncharacterized protein n=1 Tax=Thermohahella caldifontis TaxID=3142973 RepID=A0AB39V127_9GAMM